MVGNHQSLCHHIYEYVTNDVTNEFGGKSTPCPLETIIVTLILLQYTTVLYTCGVSMS